jgi:hypothetical protein
MPNMIDPPKRHEQIMAISSKHPLILGDCQLDLVWFLLELGDFPNVPSGLLAHHDGNALARSDWVRGWPHRLVGDRLRLSPEEKRFDRHKKEPGAVNSPRASTGCCLS